MTKTYKGAVFFDYDGTLTDVKAGVPVTTQATRRAVARLRENGYLAILCTGRAVPYAKGTGTDFDGMVTSNGTYATVNGEEILNCPIDADITARFVARLDGMKIDYGIDNPAICLSPDVTTPVFRHWIRSYSLPPEAFRDIVPGEPIAAYKFSVLYHTDEEIELLIKEFGGSLTFACQRGFKNADVNMYGFDKSTGVKAIMEHFGVERENAWAFGDSDNDLPMFRAVGHAVALGDHSPVLEPYCEFITKRVCEDGVAYALGRLGLIRDI